MVIFSLELLHISKCPLPKLIYFKLKFKKLTQFQFNIITVKIIPSHLDFKHIAYHQKIAREIYEMNDFDELKNLMIILNRYCC